MSKQPRNKIKYTPSTPVWLLCLFLFFSIPSAWGFSETELDTLKSSGKKIFSTSPWRTEAGFSLQRNFEVHSRLGVDPSEEGSKSSQEQTEDSSTKDVSIDKSFFDPSSWYYSLSLALNYSLRETGFEFLKETEIFLASSFATSFTGQNFDDADYGYGDYIQEGFQDITVGLTAPAYRKGSLLSFFTVSIMPYRLSELSRQAGLITTLSGAVNFLYFLKKKEKWSLSLASQHGASYSQYTKTSPDRDGSRHNIPLDTSHGGGLIYRQGYSRYAPFSSRFSVSHYAGIDSSSARAINQDLSLALSFAWKIKDRLYFNFSTRWKDRFSVRSFKPSKRDIGKNIIPAWPWDGWGDFIQHTYFIFGASYSF